MRLYVVAQVDYEEYTIIGIYSSEKRAKKVRAKFNKLIKEEWRAHLHFYKNVESYTKMYSRAPHQRCIINVFELNDEAKTAFREEEYLKSIKWLLTHVHEKIRV